MPRVAACLFVLIMSWVRPSMSQQAAAKVKSDHELPARDVLDTDAAIARSTRATDPRVATPHDLRIASTPTPSVRVGGLRERRRAHPHPILFKPSPS